MRTLRHLNWILLFFLTLSQGCASTRIVRDAATYQAEVEAARDFAAASLPLLEVELAGVRGTGECPVVADLVIYAKYWAPYHAMAALAAADLGPDPGAPPQGVPSVSDLCEVSP